jgi:hypothetical protein
MSHIADVLASAANDSSISISDIGYSLKYVGYIDNPGICDTPREDTILRSRILVIPEVKCKIDILKETQMIGRHILVIRELMEPQPGDAYGQARIVWKIDYVRLAEMWGVIA